MNFIPVTTLDLFTASLLVLINGVLSYRLRLGIEKRLITAAIRMLVQLSLLGLVLKYLFATVSPMWTALAAAAMVAFAGREIRARQSRRLAGWWAYGLGTSSMLIAATLVTIIALTVQVQPSPWYHPRYAIPLLGMVLGNTMTGLSIALDTLNVSVVRDRSAIEARLALGATAFEAFGADLRQSMRSGLIPIVNAMSASGLVILPGMMTGQILAGIDPAQAIKYQILIMFLIAGATGIGVLLGVFASAWRLTDKRQRLRLDRLSPTEAAW